MAEHEVVVWAAGERRGGTFEAQVYIVWNGRWLKEAEGKRCEHQMRQESREGGAGRTGLKGYWVGI